MALETIQRGAWRTIHYFDSPLSEPLRQHTKAGEPVLAVGRIPKRLGVVAVVVSLSVRMLAVEAEHDDFLRAQHVSKVYSLVAGVIAPDGILAKFTLGNSRELFTARPAFPRCNPSAA
ncbi:MAG: hypothetical protein GVY36_19250 [Verrucomicrobia bacterium]|nr:hypothetical protein [Verrucomicrobiota bacterium]